LMRALWEALPSSRQGGYAETSSALEPHVLAAIHQGDAVMIKGSLGSRMAPIVKALQKRYRSATPGAARAQVSTMNG
jgi:UDP-N-acetylmuramoyl-tripeptide--D-alanyl-D-alanine ligase